MKAIYVKLCEECPFHSGFYNREPLLFCEKALFQINPVDEIPYWCPLLDASQQVNIQRTVSVSVQSVVGLIYMSECIYIYCVVCTLIKTPGQNIFIKTPGQNIFLQFIFLCLCLSVSVYVSLSLFMFLSLLIYPPSLGPYYSTHIHYSSTISP